MPSADDEDKSASHGQHQAGKLESLTASAFPPGNPVILRQQRNWLRAMAESLQDSAVSHFETFPRLRKLRGAPGWPGAQRQSRARAQILEQPRLAKSSAAGDHIEPRPIPLHRRILVEPILQLTA